MNSRIGWLAGLILGVVLCGVTTPASAQGLIWKLPAGDNEWVRYEGKQTQTESRVDQDLTLQWARQLTISAVGRESVEFEGRETPCQWIEFKLETGQSSPEGVATGPYGSLIYKVLIPERYVTGKLSDADEIPVTFLPIVRGYRKVGDQPVEPLKSKVLYVHPMISLLKHYETLEAEGTEPEPVGDVMARHYKGSTVAVSDYRRSTNTADMWRSDEIPFGLAKWTVKVTREVKDAVQPTDAFQQDSTTVIEMTAVETGSGSVSELPGAE